MNDGKLNSITAVIVTINRPDCVRRCLTALQSQVPAVHQIIVVDGSPDDRTRDVVDSFPGVLFLKNSKGLGHTTLSRNMAMRHVTGDLVAFLDDDAYARPGWAAAVIETFAQDPKIGAVAGRALNGQPGEETEGADRVGKLTANGEVLGFFAADTGRVVDVDHAIGCNMCIRRDVIARCGGFRDGFSGRYCFREESDIFLVMKGMGYRVVFQPRAVADHVAGPKPKGRRFDIWYAYYCERNHYILLIRNYGILSAKVWRYFTVSMLRVCRDAVRHFLRAAAHVFSPLAGTVSGLFMGVVWRMKQGPDPVRRDQTGREVAAALGGEEPRQTMVKAEPSSNEPMIGAATTAK